MNLKLEVVIVPVSDVDRARLNGRSPEEAAAAADHYMEQK